jgi:hypothetical protein
MGLFAHWVCVKGPADALREAGYGRVVETKTPGWLTGYPDEDAQLPEWVEFDELVARVAAAAGAPAVGSWVYDSDVGYLTAADERGDIARLMINPDAGDAYDLSVAEGWPDGAIAGFAAWSSGAPNALDASAIEEVVGRDWTFAEEGVQDLHERLGLSLPYEVQPDAAVPTPLPRATLDVDVGADELAGFVRPLEVLPTLRLIMRELPWKEARYVAGHGSDFVGIWDRRRPAEPVERFPSDHSGLLQAYDAVVGLSFEDTLARTELPGLRLFLPRVEPRLVQQQVAPDFLDHLQGLSAADRASLEEDLQRGSLVRAPAGPWLLTEEDDETSWRPSVGGSGGFFLYGSGFTGVETEDERFLVCQGNFASEEEARTTATRRYAQGAWREVPEEVPGNLLDTVRWLFANG